MMERSNTTDNRLENTIVVQTIVNQDSHERRLCSICLEDFSTQPKGLYYIKQCSQRHIYCKNCLELYIIDKINDGITHIKCPAYKCDAYATYTGIQKFLNSNKVVSNKLQRFYAMKNDPNYRDCPSCHKQLHFTQSTVVCECGMVSCFIHGGAHLHESCQDYTERTLANETASMNVIQASCKQCPQCGVMTEHSGGCSQMVCTRCSNKWNWNRGTSNNCVHAAVQCVQGVMIAMPVAAVLIVMFMLL